MSKRAFFLFVSDNHFFQSHCVIEKDKVRDSLITVLLQQFDWYSGNPSYRIHFKVLSITVSLLSVRSFTILSISVEKSKTLWEEVFVFSLYKFFLYTLNSILVTFVYSSSRVNITRSDLCLNYRTFA